MAQIAFSKLLRQQAVVAVDALLHITELVAVLAVAVITQAQVAQVQQTKATLVVLDIVQKTLAVAVVLALSVHQQEPHLLVMVVMV